MTIKILGCILFQLESKCLRRCRLIALSNLSYNFFLPLLNVSQQIICSQILRELAQLVRWHASYEKDDLDFTFYLNRLCLMSSITNLSSSENLGSRLERNTQTTTFNFQNCPKSEIFYGQQHLIKSFSQSIQNDIPNKLKQIHNSIYYSIEHSNGAANS